MSASGWDELLADLDDDQGDENVEWGVQRRLDVGTTLAIYWRGQDEWQGNYGPVPVYLLTEEDGTNVFLFGGRTQLDKRIAEAAPNVGDRIAIRRLEDAPAEEGRSPAWRVRVAVRPGDGTLPAARAENDDVVETDDIPFLCPVAYVTPSA